MKPKHIIYYRSAKVGSNSIINAIHTSEYRSIHLTGKSDLNLINLEEYQIIIVGGGPTVNRSSSSKSWFDTAQEHIARLTNCISFAICRDPYTKFLSGINYCYDRGTLTEDDFNNIISCAEYITRDNSSLNEHDYVHSLRPQTDCLYTNNKQHVDVIVRFEDLNTDVSQFFKNNGFNITLKNRMNVTKSKKFIRSKLVEQFVNKQFSVDFKNFNYQKITTKGKEVSRNQIANHTGYDRYPDIFSDVVKTVQNNQPAQILSFGCSTADECKTLKDLYFPKSKIIGFDVHESIIANNIITNQHEDVSYYSDINDITTKIDLIFAMSVLCVWPEHKYPIAFKNYNYDQFVSTLNIIDELLNVGGYLCLFNTKYLFIETDIFRKKYEIVRSCQHIPFVYNYTKNNTRVDQSPYFLYRKINDTK